MVGQQQRPNTSEYRRSFKESKFRCFSRTYEDNLDYRQCRRRAEHDHNVDVFSWNEPNWDSESGSSNDNQRPASVPIHIFKHQKLNESYSARLNRTQEIQVKGPQFQTTAIVNEKTAKAPLCPRSQGEKQTPSIDKAVNDGNERQEPRSQETVKDQAQQTSGEILFSSLILSYLLIQG